MQKEMSSLREDLAATSEREKQLFDEVGFLREQLRNERFATGFNNNTMWIFVKKGDSPIFFTELLFHK